MRIELLIHKINTEVISAFALLDSCFDKREELLQEKIDNRQTFAEGLHSIALANRFFVLHIEEGSKKAVRAGAHEEIGEALRDYHLHHPAFDRIDISGSLHVQHQAMDNTSLAGVRRELRDQLYICLCALDDLSKGEGVLHSVAVEDIGRLDVYQLIYFVALQIKQHSILLLDHERKYDLRELIP